jgi:WS/DGAT/MGAT family acyltransferase
MSNYTYERLSFQDNTFLQAESHDVHMHVASTLIFEAGPLRTAAGGIDVSAIKDSIVDVLHRIPRYRQRLAWIPLEDHAVWVDDPHFDVDYHVRHTALPRPGTPEQLKKLSARIMSQQLDRKRPLWETWVVEGLDEGESFALITKIHHCMIDGSSGVDLAHVLLSPSPEPQQIGERPPFIPRPIPTGAELFRDALRRRIEAPLRAIRDFQAFAGQVDDVREELSIRARAIVDLLALGGSAVPTPLNGDVGPHRRFDWLEVPLDELKAIRKAWGCTINDVVLTIVTGAVREYLIHRAVDPAGCEFKISAPVSVRSEEERGRMGNRVSSWTLAVPIGESDPRKQLEAIHAETQRLRKTRQALGVETMMTVASWAPSTLVSLGAQSMSNPTNLLVTNVPGPQMPLYCSGARLRAIFPQVPLLQNQGIGIALMSYAGSVCWGFNSDPGVIPDADVFVKKIAEAVGRVREAAAVAPEKKARRSRSKRPTAARPKVPAAAQESDATRH